MNAWLYPLSKENKVYDNRFKSARGLLYSLMYVLGLGVIDHIFSKL